jgi:predicted PurR-regulated permease PerM
MSDYAANQSSQPSLGRFAAYVGITCGIVAVFALAWILRDVLLIAFGAIVFAVAIRAAARPLSRFAHLREQWAVGIVVVLLVAGALALGWLFGRQIAQQLQGLGERLPQAVEEVRTWLETQPAGKFVLARISGLSEGGASLAGLQKFVAISATTAGHAVLMFFGGIFMASNPALYLDGFVRLFPIGYRRKLHGALVESGDALRKWLLGQLVSMTCVGTLTGIGLWIVGAPLPLVLGIIAGLLNFIPILGPIIAAGPGILVALTDGPQTAVYAAIVYFVVQELEGHAITPLAQRWAVRLPPAYGLVAVLSFALLFGFFGVLFGIPLAVVVMCLVRNLYVENGLEKVAPRRGRAEARLRGATG